MNLFAQIYEDFNLDADWKLEIVIGDINYNGFVSKKYWFENAVVKLLTFADYEQKVLKIGCRSL